MLKLVCAPMITRVREGFTRFIRIHGYDPDSDIYIWYNTNSNLLECFKMNNNEIQNKTASVGTL